MGSVGPAQDMGRTQALFPQDAQSLGTCTAAAMRTTPSPPAFLVDSERTAPLLLPQHQSVAAAPWEQSTASRSGRVRTPVLCSSSGVILGHVLGTASQGFPVGSTCSYPLRWLALSQSIGCLLFPV